jgi:hypothetical protein
MYVSRTRAVTRPLKSSRWGCGSSSSATGERRHHWLRAPRRELRAASLVLLAAPSTACFSCCVDHPSLPCSSRWTVRLGRSEALPFDAAERPALSAVATRCGEVRVLSRLGRALLGAVFGYVLAAVAAYALTHAFSPNRHDLELEALMTAFFVAGPFGAVVGTLAGALYRRHSAG